MTMTRPSHPPGADGPASPSAASIVLRAVAGVLMASLFACALQRAVDASAVRAAIGVTVVAAGSAGALVATAALLGFDIAVVEECLSRLLLQRCLVALCGGLVGGALQVVATVLMYVPWTSDMPGWRTAQLLSFSLAATALATSRLGLASAIAFHAAFDGALLCIYGSASLAPPLDRAVIAPLLAMPAGPRPWAETSLTCGVVAA